MKTGEYFVRKGKLTSEILNTALKIQKITKERIGKIFIELGRITRDELAEYLSKHNPEALVEEKTVISTIPQELLKKHVCTVLSETKDILYIAGIDPIPLKQKLEKMIGKKVEVLPVSLEFLLSNIQAQSQEALNTTNPNVLLNRLMKEAVNRNCSDIHIEVMKSYTVVRFRIDGVLHIRYIFDQQSGESLIARIKGIADMDIAERRFPQDGAFSYDISASKAVNVRVSTMPAVGGEVCVLRILDKDKVVIGLDQIGIRKLDQWKQAIANKDGVILVTGATGSGKSTTLYSTMLYLDRFQKSIITVEDPVEYQFPFIRQVQVNEILNLDFATFLKHTLRQDPDVIIVGEVRDEETARTMMRAAETGHLVFATLHSNDIPTTFSRLMDLGVRVGDLKYLLRCILSQTLLRRVCTACKGKGCENCDHVGYRGRVLASELELFDPDRVELFLKEKPSYQTILDDALLLMKEGVIDAREIERVFGVSP